MSSERLLFLVVAAYVGIVLWFLAFGDSLARRLQLRHTAAAAMRACLRSRRFFLGAVAAAIFAALGAVAVVATHQSGSRGGISRQADLKLRLTDHALLHLAPAQSLLVRAARAPARSAARTPARRAKLAHVPRAPQVQATRVSYVVKTVPVASQTPAAQPVRSAGPSPLPSPAGSSPPSPLTAP